MGDGKRGKGKAKRERVSGAPLSFLESSHCIRLLGALKAAPAAPVLGRFASAHILGTLVRLSFPRQRAG